MTLSFVQRPRRLVPSGRRTEQGGGGQESKGDGRRAVACELLPSGRVLPDSVSEWQAYTGRYSEGRPLQPRRPDRPELRDAPYLLDFAQESDHPWILS